MYINSSDLEFLKELAKELFLEELETARVVELQNLVKRIEDNHDALKERQRVQMQQRRAVNKNYGRKKVDKDV